MLEDQAQALPVQPAVVRVLAWKVILNDHRLGVEFVAVVYRVACAQALVRADLSCIGGVLALDEAVEILGESHLSRFAATVERAPGVGGGISHQTGGLVWGENQVLGHNVRIRGESQPDFRVYKRRQPTHITGLQCLDSRLCQGEHLALLEGDQHAALKCVRLRCLLVRAALRVVWCVGDHLHLEDPSVDGQRLDAHAIP